MSATADIETESAQNVMLIPVSALFFKPLSLNMSDVEKRPAMLRGPPSHKPKRSREVQTDITSKNAVIYVLVNGLPEERHIVTGVSDGKNIQVVSGLSETDEIITSMKRRQ